MSRAPTIAHWLLAGLAVSFAGVLYDAARTNPRSTLHDVIRRYDAAPGHGVLQPAHVNAAVLLQLRDCSSNLRMLHVLRRGPARGRIRLAVIWYAGPVGDSVSIRAELPSWTANTPLHPAPKAILKQFAELGHTTTPALVVADLEGRVRFTTQSPRSSREVAGLRRIIEGLTFIEEL